jgi:hypothetical protein
LHGGDERLVLERFAHVGVEAGLARSPVAVLAREAGHGDDRRGRVPRIAAQLLDSS